MGVWRMAEGAGWSISRHQVMGVEGDTVSKRINVTEQNVQSACGMELCWKRGERIDQGGKQECDNEGLHCLVLQTVPSWAGHRTYSCILGTREREGIFNLSCFPSFLSLFIHVGLKKVKGHIFLGLRDKVKMLEKQM